MARRITLISIIAFLIVPLCMHGGQTTPQPSGSPKQIEAGGWTVSGSLRLRLESWDRFEAETGGNAYAYGDHRLGIFLKQG